MLSTPVLYIMFNRPDLVKKTFPTVKEQKPTRLFIACDGPRETHPSDRLKVQECREWVMGQVNWDCELKTLFRIENLGCGLAVSGAIDWFFENVDHGIILEDDLVVNESFFSFQEKMLSSYKDDQRILHVSGSNFLFKDNSKIEYYFSKFPNTWGWGTWKNRWQLFDFDIKIELDLLNSFCLKYHNEFVRDIWFNRIKDLENKSVDAWDYQWFLQLVKNDLSTIVPGSNLVKNIGKGLDATHTFSFSRKYDKIKLGKVSVNSEIPMHVKYNKEFDLLHVQNMFNESSSLKNSMRNLAYKLIPKSIYSFLKDIFWKFYG